MVSVHYLDIYSIMSTPCFDTDFASEINLTKFPYFWSWISNQITNRGSFLHILIGFIVAHWNMTKVRAFRNFKCIFWIDVSIPDIGRLLLKAAFGSLPPFINFPSFIFRILVLFQILVTICSISPQLLHNRKIRTPRNDESSKNPFDTGR